MDESSTGFCRSLSGSAGTGRGKSGKVGRLFLGNGRMLLVLGRVKSSSVGCSYFLGLCLRITFFGWFFLLVPVSAGGRSRGTDVSGLDGPGCGS